MPQKVWQLDKQRDTWKDMPYKVINSNWIHLTFLPCEHKGKSIQIEFALIISSLSTKWRNSYFLRDYVNNIECPAQINYISSKFTSCTKGKTIFHIFKYAYWLWFKEKGFFNYFNSQNLFVEWTQWEVNPNSILVEFAFTCLIPCVNAKWIELVFKRCEVNSHFLQNGNLFHVNRTF